MSAMKRHTGQTRIYVSALMTHALKHGKSIIPTVFMEELSRERPQLLQIFETMKMCFARPQFELVAYDGDEEIQVDSRRD